MQINVPKIYISRIFPALSLFVTHSWGYHVEILLLFSNRFGLNQIINLLAQSQRGNITQLQSIRATYILLPRLLYGYLPFQYNPQKKLSNIFC